MAWIIEEEKEFTTLGETRTGKIVKIKIAHWPTQSEARMREVLVNMQQALPESTFTITEA